MERAAPGTGFSMTPEGLHWRFAHDEQGFIFPPEHERRKAEARYALQALEADEDWQNAVAPVDPKTRFSVYVIEPEAQDAVSKLRRKGADCLNDDGFARKDGDDRDETMGKFAPFAEGDIRIAVVEHDATSGRSRMVNALRVVQQVPGRLLPSFEALATEWGLNPYRKLDMITLPNGEPASTLLTHPGVFDIDLISSAEGWDTKSNLLSSQTLLATYKAALAVIKKRGGKYIVGTMDVETVFNQLAGRGGRAWVDGTPLCHRQILSSVPNSNVSTFAICDTELYEAENRDNPKRRVRYGTFWGPTLEERGIAFHGIQDDAPRWERMPFAYAFRPEELAAFSWGAEADHHPELDAPTLVMDLPAITSMYGSLRRLIGAEVCYAMKCNPHPDILRLLHDKGGNFEVASLAEAQLLHDLGIGLSRVLFSNPVKFASHIKGAYELGIRTFAFDSADELAKLKAYAPGSNVYVRLATNAGNSVVGSEGKFGVDVDTADALLRLAMQPDDHGRTLVPYGLAFHVGSQVERPRPWLMAMRMAGELLRRWNGQLEMVDMGGGFPAYHKEGLPSVGQIATVIRQGIYEWPERPRRLVIEPGRGLVSNAGVLVLTAMGVGFRHGQKTIHTNIGIQVERLEAPDMLFPMTDSLRSQNKRPTKLTAATCDGGDVLAIGALLSAELQRGDQIYVGSAGAYTTSYEGNFNGFLPTRIVVRH